MVAQIWTALCGVPINETNVKDAKRRGGAPDALQGSVDCLTFEDQAFARALLSWRNGAWEILKKLCKPGSQAAMRLETIVDLVLLDPDAEFDDSEPDYDPDFDEDFGPDFEFPMEAAPPLDFACANAH